MRPPWVSRRIVAGVDGSLPSRAALGWAVRHAALTGAAVEAVIAWEPPAGSWLHAAPDEDSPAIAAQILADVIADAGTPGLVRPSVRKGHPAQVLIGASAEAELLVIGGRRTPGEGFPGAPLGPVSQRCVQHAHCPVVVIHADQLPDDMAPIAGACLPARTPCSVR